MNVANPRLSPIATFFNLIPLALSASSITSSSLLKTPLNSSPATRATIADSRGAVSTNPTIASPIALIKLSTSLSSFHLILRKSISLMNVPIDCPTFFQSVFLNAVVSASIIPFAQTFNVSANALKSKSLKNRLIPAAIDSPRLVQSKVSPKESAA